MLIKRYTVKENSKKAFGFNEKLTHGKFVLAVTSQAVRISLLVIGCSDHRDRSSEPTASLDSHGTPHPVWGPQSGGGFAEVSHAAAGANTTGPWSFDLVL